MKVTVLQENLVKGVMAVLRVTTTGGQLPILSHILIKANKSGLFLKGTDLEISVSLKLGAKVEKEGSFAIPAKIFGEFVSSLQPGKVSLILKKEKLEVKSGDNKALFQGMSASEYPEVPEILENNEVEFKESIQTTVNQVAMSAATDESRPILTGVQMKKDGLKMRLVATDGYRLSIGWVKVVFNKKSDWVRVIPAKALSEVSLLMKTFSLKEKMKMGLTKNGNQIVFAFGDVVVGTRLIEGEFPPFEHILPDKGETRVKFDYDEMLAAARMAAIFARESANIVKWNVGKGQIVIKANSPQVGENESKVDVKMDGEGGEIAFNSRYLLDYLGVISSGGEIVFEMSGSLAPGLFRVEGKSDFLHVIMPVRVQKD